MSLWFSPFPLQPALEQRLQVCGWAAWRQDLDDLPQDALLLYATPDQLLADSASSLGLDDLLLGYQHVLSHCTQHRLLSTWRLQACTDDQLRAGLPSPAEALAWPAVDPLAALITKQVLDAHPALLDAYLDLELKADLLGGEPDSRYRKRLMGDLQPNALLQAWRQPSALSAELSEAQQQLTEAREEAELTLLQLHQVQEELEHYFLLSSSQTSQLERYDHLLRRSEGLLSSAVV